MPATHFESNYNTTVGSIRSNKQAKSLQFGEVVQRIIPGVWFKSNITNITSGAPMASNTVSIDKYIYIINVTSVGIECFVIDIYGVYDGNDLQIKKINAHREIYPSFPEAFFEEWNADCDIMTGRGSDIGPAESADFMRNDMDGLFDEMFHQVVRDARAAQAITPSDGRGGGEKGVTDPDIDVTIYTGNNPEICEQFGAIIDDPNEGSGEDPDEGSGEDPNMDR